MPPIWSQLRSRLAQVFPLTSLGLLLGLRYAELAVSENKAYSLSCFLFDILLLQLFLFLPLFRSPTS